MLILPSKTTNYEYFFAVGRGPRGDLGVRIYVQIHTRGFLVCIPSCTLFVITFASTGLYL